MLGYVNQAGDVCFVDTMRNSAMETFPFEGGNEMLLAISGDEATYGKGLVVAHKVAGYGENDESFLKFYVFDLEHKAMLPFRRIRYSKTKGKICISNSLKKIIYFVNSNLVIATIDHQKDLKVTVLLDGKRFSLSLQTWRVSLKSKRTDLMTSLFSTNASQTRRKWHTCSRNRESSSLQMQRRRR